MTATVIVPGLRDSGPGHWQTWLQARLPDCTRAHQDNWDLPVLQCWEANLRRTLDRSDRPAVIVAHSFGCLATIAASAGETDPAIVGALLVAPADPVNFGLADARLANELPFPSLVVASTNDPWMDFERARFWSDTWGSDLVDLGDAGHINVESGHGPWPDALNLIARLQASAMARSVFSDGYTLQGVYA